MPVHEATEKLPRVVDTDRTLAVYVHHDALMTVPKSQWLWDLNWLDEPERSETTASDRQVAMGVLESYRYLVTECTQAEAWHRIQQLRRAVRAYDKTAD